MVNSEYKIWSAKETERKNREMVDITLTLRELELILNGISGSESEGFYGEDEYEAKKLYNRLARIATDNKIELTLNEYELED